MGEVVVVAIMTANEGQRDELEALAKEIVIPSTHDEEGCITFALHRDVRDPSRLAFIERWASSEALEKHLQQPHLAAFREKAGPLNAQPPTILVLEASVAGDPAKGILG